MRFIQFNAHFGYEAKNVEITAVFLGPQGNHVYIDKYYCGNMVKLHGEWVLHTNNHRLQWSDILVLGQIIEEMVLT